jgi:hypothetical protein
MSVEKWSEGTEFNYAIFTTVGDLVGFREYLTGLLAPRDRNKTLTCLAAAAVATISRLEKS